MALQLHAEGRSHYSFLFTARLLAGTQSINHTLIRQHAILLLCASSDV